MNGYAVTALFDTGAQVSLIDQTWRQKYVPNQEVHPLSELMGECDLKLLAATGEVIPYDGWIEVIVNLPGNDNPNHSIKVPFLVSCNELLRPLLGFNVIQEIILRQGDETDFLPSATFLEGPCKLRPTKSRLW